VVAGWDHPHHVEPGATEDRIVRGFHVDHEEFRDDIVRVDVDMKRDRAERSNVIPVKPIQIGLGLRVDRGSDHLPSALYSVQSASVLDIDATSAVD